MNVKEKKKENLQRLFKGSISVSSTPHELIKTAHTFVGSAVVAFLLSFCRMSRRMNCHDDSKTNRYTKKKLETVEKGKARDERKK